MKDFVKVMDQTGYTFRYFTEKLPGISAAKTKEGVFICPQMLRAPQTQFDQILICDEKRI
jgi:hypothetical protein